MAYIFTERENQRTPENRVYDIQFNGVNIGWMDQEKNYAPHVRIMDTRHQLNKKEMVEAIQQLSKSDGSFFLLSDLITKADVNIVTVEDLKSHVERLRTEIEVTQTEADSFLKYHRKKLQEIKVLQKQTDDIIKQIQSMQSDS